MIYFDNAATTSVKPQVVQKILPWLSEHYGNPSSIYRIGREAAKAIESARENIAACLGCDAREIYFTGSGSESDNWAIKGIMDAHSKRGIKIITSAIEHHAVLTTCENIAKRGYEVTYLPVDSNGLVSPNDLANAIDDNTVLVSIMMANNEIGTIQPIRELAAVAHEKGVLFHTDAVQAVGSIPIDVRELGVDLLSISAHKFHGPKGVGALYIKKGVKISSLIQGGAQERGRRAATENTAFIVGMAEALKISVENLEENSARIKGLRDKLVDRVLNTIPRSRLNGHPEKRLPGNANFSFDFIEGESLLLMLDMQDIAASSGSACTSGSLDPSHVLLAIGLPHETAHGSLRVSIGDENTDEEIEKLLSVLPQIVDRLRRMSPLYERD